MRMILRYHPCIGPNHATAKWTATHDLYHTQLGEGDLIGWSRRCLPWIGEIQVADVPGRCEPGTGEINFPGIARALDEMGYRGPVAMGAYAAGDSDAALQAFRKAFTL